MAGTNDLSHLHPTVIQFAGSKPDGKVIFALDAAKQAGEQVKILGGSNVLIIRDPVVGKLGVDKPVLDSLNAEGLTYQIFEDVEPEPHVETMQKVIDIVNNDKIDIVIGTGGGSAMDTAKMAALAPNGKTVLELLDDNSLVQTNLPTILITTTSGTGSEVSPFIVAADGKQKRFVASPYTFATVAIVDPLLTVTMPPKVTAATGMDALTHALEGATGKPTPYTIAMACKCAQLCDRYLARAVKDGNDVEARYYMSYASVMGMLAYTQGSGLYAHSMSYVLTAEVGLPHGAGCGLALPDTMEFNREYTEELMEELNRAVETDDYIQHMRDMMKEIGAPRKLKELGIKQEQVPELARILVENYYRANNPRPMSKEEALEVVQAMYE